MEHEVSKHEHTFPAIGSALIALAIFILSRIIYSALLLFLLLPILLTLLLEKRDLKSIGFTFERNLTTKYLAYGLLCFMAQVVILAAVALVTRRVFGQQFDLEMPPNLLRELFEQLYLVGLPEEVYYRGYLQTRLGAWLGDKAGYGLAALLFGLGHVISRVQDYGVGYLGPALAVGAGALVGGLVFGLPLLRTKSIYPSVVAHIATNMFAAGIAGAVLG
jgi:membrane protease YdiL (CAAX protease family)